MEPEEPENHTTDGEKIQEDEDNKFDCWKDGATDEELRAGYPHKDRREPETEDQSMEPTHGREEGDIMTQELDVGPRYVWLQGILPNGGVLEGRKTWCEFRDSHRDVMYQSVLSAQEEIREILERTRVNRIKLDRIYSAVFEYAKADSKFRDKQTFVNAMLRILNDT